MQEKRNGTEKQESGHLPIYGVGPYYGAGVILCTVIGIVLTAAGVLQRGTVTNGIGMAMMIVLGVLFMVEGILIWRFAAIGKDCIDQYIQRNELCQTGVYAVVRNPCYSGIMLLCTGILLAAHNVYLLPLPVIFWAAMTVLMKKTEERWLAELYGQAYTDYCKRVNRCIPWFPKKP